MKPNPVFKLPQDLPPKTAMAVYDLLIELTDAFWYQYESELVPLIIEELKLPPLPQQQLDFDDDIPF